MKRTIWLACLVLGVWQVGQTQILDLQLYLVDSITKTPIADAHMFISDSSLGTVSEEGGYVELQIDAQENQVLILTHVAYETLVLEPTTYRQLQASDTIALAPNGLDLAEISLTAKRGSQWRKKFRKVRRVLIGEGKPATDCKIVNPEVLRFHEKDGTLWASAVDMLYIENDHLGYDLKFWLDELAIEADGSAYFKGYGQFTDQEGEDNLRMLRRRNTIYRHSLPHLLRSLLAKPDRNTLKDQGYELSFDRYADGVFTTVIIPEPPAALVQPDTSEGLHRLYFTDFLTVQHQGLQLAAEGQRTQMAVSAAEQQRFGSGREQSFGSNTVNAISRLYKLGPYLLFDERGQILNKADVREYGYWAQQRLATTLPIDFVSEEQLVPRQEQGVDTLQLFQQFLSETPSQREMAMAFFQDNWSPTYLAPLLDILRLSQNPWQQDAIRSLLTKHAPTMSDNYFEAIPRLWAQPPQYGTYYADFKAYLYSGLDVAFTNYFHQRGDQSRIRFDEIVWGGVAQDGIPPLRFPEMIGAASATYLSKTDLVFGLVVGEQAYAYPKRILAWHEFFTDQIGEQSIAGVYCTLCGTVIVYNTDHAGVRHQLGTSGFLYRSNKLMYDQATQSLWSTFTGEPVVGPLVGQGIKLTTLPVETTTWGEWRSRYPNTQVLSLETGYRRNYDEGEAYRAYFATDELMFPVPLQDERLPNKARVFIPRPAHYEQDPLAISVAYLQREQLWQGRIGDERIVVLTEATGASRAYAIADQVFAKYQNGKLRDQMDQEWQVTTAALIGPQGERLARISAHEAFWFGWLNVFPDTRLVK